MANSDELPSLLGITVRRSLTVGRISLLIGTGMVVIYSAAFGFGGALLSTVGALVLPIFAVSGGLGGALVYTNDRMKGVLEYLASYGVSSRHLLLNAIVAGIVQATIVLSAGTAAGVATYLLSGNVLTAQLPESLLAYTFPMSYLTVTMMTTVGVFWTSLASPRSGMNSPLGVLPLLGVMPTAAVLVVALALPAHGVQIALAAELVMFVVVLSLLARTDRFMPTERLLSPA
jgi:hypothetical protein